MNGSCFSLALLSANITYADAVMAEARALAGPEDAKTMVGKDFGGLTVIE